MAEVKILVEGYTTADSNNSEEEETCANISLVKDGDIVMIVDPGLLESQNVLIEKLKKERLNVDDINLVFITHSHIDHYRNIGMFPKAKALEYWGLWDGVNVDDRKNKLSENIEIIETPGHSYDGLTLLIKTNLGIIAICGDVFWKENYPEFDEYASDMEKLKESRKKVLESADYVIPGHGKMYKVKK